jgi:Ca-activated chloride channel family protein
MSVLLLAQAATTAAEAVADAAAGGGGVQSAAAGRLALWGDYSLADPLFLLLVPIGIAALWHGRTRKPRGNVPLLPAAEVPRSLAQRLGWIPTVLQVAALLFVAVALARPLRGSVVTTSTSEGVDIALVIDRSSSMQHQDLAPGRSRLDVVKDVVSAFAVRRMTDRESAADNVALISFAAYPELLCPFTLDVDAVTGFLAGLQHVDNRHEDGTAIGVALAKAVAVLRETEAESKVVVLLTDGENNIDLIAPLEAAELAAEQKIRVHTVFAGRYVFTVDVFGKTHATDRKIDTSELERIAELTGGRFFRATDSEGLEDVYRRIEALERTEREEKRFSESYDLYLAFLGVGLAAYVAAWLSTATWARRLP